MPQGLQLLYTDSQFEYYKITVANGTRMVEGKVAETCEKAGHGLKARDQTILQIEEFLYPTTILSMIFHIRSEVILKKSSNLYCPLDLGVC